MEKRNEIGALLYKMWQAFASQVDVKAQETIKAYIESQDRIYEILADPLDCSGCILATKGMKVAL